MLKKWIDDVTWPVRQALSRLEDVSMSLSASVERLGLELDRRPPKPEADLATITVICDVRERVEHNKPRGATYPAIGDSDWDPELPPAERIVKRVMGANTMIMRGETAEIYIDPQMPCSNFLFFLNGQNMKIEDFRIGNHSMTIGGWGGQFGWVTGKESKIGNRIIILVHNGNPR